MTPPGGLLRTVEDFFEGRVPERLGVAVSGGSDSLALLHLLHEWGRSALFVVTVNHGLRKESASEALHVARISEGLGVPHTVVEWKGWDGKGNLQDQARINRYSLVAEWAKGHSIDTVALGHTLDDRAETFLMRLSRSAGLDGLAGMASEVTRHGISFVRPLLEADRASLRAYLSSKGVRWAEDPSNEDASFERVRARKAMASLSDLGITASGLATVADNLRTERDAIAALAREKVHDIARVQSGDLVFDRAKLARLPWAVRRRILSAALRWVSSELYPPRRASLDKLLESVGVQENVTLHGCHVLVSAMTVRVVRELAAVSQLTASTDAVWDNRWNLEGPAASGLEIRALGEGIQKCPQWRETGMPRLSLLASPAVWKGEELVAAPIAGFGSGWSAHAPDLAEFEAFLILH